MHETSSELLKRHIEKMTSERRIAHNRKVFKATSAFVLAISALYLLQLNFAPSNFFLPADNS